MTKVQTLTETGDISGQKPNPVPIELVSYLNSSGTWSKALCKPNKFTSITLLSKGYFPNKPGKDLMFAISNLGPCLYGGNWNDGVV